MKMNKNNSRVLALLALVVCVLSVPAASIQNAGFETPVLSEGGFSSGAPSGWTRLAVTNIHVRHPYSSELLQPTEGNNLLWIGSGNNQIIQDVVTIEADTIYRIQVDVGVDSSFTWYRCALRYDGAAWNEFLVDVNQNNFWPTPNGWVTAILEFNSFESPSLVGKTLQIYLAGEDIAFDNVRYRYQPYWDGAFNGDFSYDTLPQGQSSTDFYPSGWVTHGAVELRHPADGEPLQPIAGQNYLRVVDGGVQYYPQGGIYPQTRYDFQVDVARPSDLSFEWYQAALVYFDGTEWHTLDASNHHTNPLHQSNQWTTLSFEFTGNAATIGHLLYLQLDGKGVAFDNVRMTETILRTDGPNTFYVSRSQGNDFYSGKSKTRPWRSFNKFKTMRMLPGDRILLKRGDVWNEQLHLWGNGQEGNPIELSAYGQGPKPRIERTDQATERCAVIESPSYWHINNLDFRNAKVGIYLRYIQSRHNRDVLIEDCYFQDMNQVDVWNPAYYDYELSFNTGIMVGGKIWEINSYQPVLEDLVIRNCGFQRTSHSVLINWYFPPRYRNRVRNLIIEDCWHTGGYGVGLFHVNGGHMKRCYFFEGEARYMPTGTTQPIDGYRDGADINRDGRVDLLDFVQFAETWLN